MVGNRTHGKYRFLRIFIFCSLFPVAGCLIFSGCGGGGSGTTFTQPQVTLKKAVQVEAGWTSTCALLSDGSVKCWGSVSTIENDTVKQSFKPVSVPGIANAINIETFRDDNRCVTIAGGNVMCWGENSAGQLGNGQTSASYIPASVLNVTNATFVTVGSLFSCALLSDKTIKCWGSNGTGEIGSGDHPGPQTCGEYTYSDACSTVPVSVSNINSAVGVAAGELHACALLENGKVKCWGSNWLGQLGIGQLEVTEPKPCGVVSSCVPIEVTDMNNAVKITSGHTHTCALMSDGHVSCWGDNRVGQLGTGSNTGPETCCTFTMDPYCFSCSTKPVIVPDISNATDVTAGLHHTCVILSDNSVKCWGANSLGELGYGNYADSYSPVIVNINKAIGVSAGWYHTCAIETGGDVKCWGSNFMGELGNGKSVPSYLPVAVDASLYAAAPRMMKNFYFAFAELLMRLAPG